MWAYSGTFCLHRDRITDGKKPPGPRNTVYGLALGNLELALQGEAMALLLKAMWETQQGNQGPARIASSALPTEEQNKDPSSLF